MQRRGRRGHAQFRLVVQDSRFSPTSGRVVAYLGSYDPHTKVANFDKEKATEYLKNGAQPTDRAARLLKSEGVKMPSWVKESAPAKKTIRHPEKLRKNRPEDAAKKELAHDEPAAEAQAETTEEAAEERQAEAAQTAEKPAEEAK